MIYASILFSQHLNVLISVSGNRKFEKLVDLEKSAEVLLNKAVHWTHANMVKVIEAQA